MSSRGFDRKPEVELDELRPEHAAWLIGRTLNRLQHALQVAQLTLSPGYRNTVEHCFARLLRLSRIVCGDERARMQKAACIEAARQEWRVGFDRTWHVDELFARNGELSARMERDENYSDAELVSQVCGT